MASAWPFSTSTFWIDCVFPSLSWCTTVRLASSISLTKDLLINDTLMWTSCAFFGSISFPSTSRKEISTQMADLTASHSSHLAISSASLVVIWDTFIVVPSGKTHSSTEAFTWISLS